MENGMTETDTSQEVQGEDLQRGTHTLRSPRGQSVERKAHREGANAGALGSIQTASPQHHLFSSLPSSFFFMEGGGGSFITFMTGKKKLKLSYLQGISTIH